MMGKYILILGLILFSGKKMNSQNLGKYVELSASKVTDNDNDLKQLSSYFNNITLVGMGESTHGTHEFFTMRHRMFKYLVEHHQFNTFFLEADYASCLLANEYIHGKEDDAIKAVKKIGLWPWQTHEMVALIKWMRTYNLENPINKLNFIGVDMQQYLETITQMDNILKKYNLSTTDDNIYQRMLNTNFHKVNKSDDLEIYKTTWVEKKAIDISVFNQKDEYTYTILLRYLTQIINGKNKLGKKPDYRDKKMAENILFYQNENTLTKGFFWAHNRHIMKSIFNEGKKKESGSAGGYLKQELGSQYFVIGQDFEEGTFNAYFPDSNSKKNIEGETYTLGPVTVTPFLKSSFITNYGNLKNPVFIDCSYLSQKKYIKTSSIGAVYYPEKNGNHKSENSKFYHKSSEFDAIIFIKKSTATHLLEDITNNDGN